jgi:hypothetical protein
VNKFRQGKIKREHSIIPGLLPLLERMATCAAVVSITPGPIAPQNSKETGLTFQYFTDKGLRLLGKNGSAVQEVWVVAPEKEAALDWCVAAGLVAPPPAPEPPPKAKPTGIDGPVQYCILPFAATCDLCGKPLGAGSRVAWAGTRQIRYMHVRCAKGR